MHGHNIGIGVSSLLSIVFLQLFSGGIERVVEGCIMLTFSSFRPCRVEHFNCRECVTERWNFCRWKCLLRLISMLCKSVCITISYASKNEGTLMNSKEWAKIMYMAPLSCSHGQRIYFYSFPEIVLQFNSQFINENVDMLRSFKWTKRRLGSGWNTFLSFSALFSIAYVDPHLIFMSKMSCLGIVTPSRIWMSLKCCFLDRTSVG